MSSKYGEIIKKLISVFGEKPARGLPKPPVPRRLFFAAQQRIAITSIPNYYQKMQPFTTRKNQEEHGPDVM
jgi:hypothetical protein